MTTRTADTIRQLARQQQAPRAFNVSAAGQTFEKRREYRYPLAQRTDLRRAVTLRPADWDNEE